MIDDRELTRRVTATLDAYARTVSVSDEPFVPTPPATDGVGGSPARPERRRPRLLLVATVLVLAGAMAGVVALSRSRDGADRLATSLVMLAAPVAPADGLAPTWAPDGWRRRGLGWSSPAAGLSSDPEARPEPYVGWPESGVRAQLFGDPTAPDDRERAVLVESGPDLVPHEPTVGLSVRGHTGWESDLGFGSPRTTSRPDLRTVTWTESRTQVRATFAADHRDEARAFIDRLVAREGGPSAGFDVAPGDDLALLGTATAPEVSPTYVGMSHRFTAPSGREYYLTVDAVTATGGPTVGYLTAWFHGDRAEDGTATVWDARSSTLVEVQPDGRFVRAQVFTLDARDTVTGVDEVEALGAPRPIAEQAVASVEPVDAATLETWWQEVHADRARLPLLARVGLPTADIEVRGDGEAEALCQVDGGEPVCTLGIADASGVMAMLRIDGAEYVVAGRRGAAPVFVGTEEGASESRVLDAETGHDGDWYVALVALDPSLVSVGVDAGGAGEVGEAPGNP